MVQKVYIYTAVPHSEVLTVPVNGKELYNLDHQSKKRKYWKR